MVHNSIKKFINFFAHHNGVIVALELAVFTGVILAFAADEPQNNESGIMNYELRTESQEASTIHDSSFIIQENESGEQAIVDKKQLTANSEQQITGANQNPVSLEKIQQKYEQAVEIKAKYQLEGDVLKRTAKADPKDKIEVTIGNDEMPDIALRRWDEVGFDIKAHELLKDVPAENRDLKFVGDKIMYETPEMSFEIYEYTDAGGGMKYIWYLNEKPAGNIVEFGIETEGLNFYYQSPLTEEYQDGWSDEFQTDIVVSETQVKDSEGNVLVNRPENIVGSYAVYHKTKGKLNDVNGRDYKTGKAFHIYRPHLIDAQGKEAWGDLFIDAEQGVYRVTMPSDFYNNAVYPIKSNDTFGYEGAAATGGVAGDDIIYTFYNQTYSPASDGTALSMSVKTKEFFSGVIKGALYDSADETLKGQTVAGTLPATVNTIEMEMDGSVSVYSATAYRLAFNSDANLFYMYFDDAEANPSWKYHNNNYDPTPFTNPASWTNAATVKQRMWGIYCTFEPGGTPPEAPSYQPRPGIISPSGGGFLIF